MRSKLTNTIFRDEMNQIYERKDVAYKELIEAAQDTMRELIQKMERQLCDNPVIEKQMRQLVQALETTTGKKQYGYLKKPLKALVDAIVDELARQPEVAKCYELSLIHISRPTRRNSSDRQVVADGGTCGNRKGRRHAPHQ